MLKLTLKTRNFEEVKENKPRARNIGDVRSLLTKDNLPPLHNLEEVEDQWIS